MIAAAREAHPDQEWILGQAETWSASEPCDVVFSNAALQWIPRHPSLVQRLFEQVAGGGALAFQIPSRNYSGVRDCIDEVALDLQWRVRMRGPMGALTMEDAPCYYDALVGQARALDMWETEYHHVLDDPTAIVTWISGTGLRPFLSVLDDDAERGRFTAMLSERVAAVYPRRADGKVLFPFKRLFVVAYR
jgi:trans-aconitate 2-methyltransferase